MEDEVHELWCNARSCLRQKHKECDARIRESPTSAIIGAMAVGYMLHRLPLRSILVTKVRVISALAPPALFLFGVAKLYDFLQSHARTNPD